jgi:hypothetical protein
LRAIVRDRFSLKSHHPIDKERRVRRHDRPRMARQPGIAGFAADRVDLLRDRIPKPQPELHCSIDQPNRGRIRSDHAAVINPSRQLRQRSALALVKRAQE